MDQSLQAWKVLETVELAVAALAKVSDMDVEQRLASLREEYAKGEQMLADMEREASEIRDSLLRIAGAIQVLEELQGAGVPGDGSAAGPSGDSISGGASSGS